VLSARDPCGPAFAGAGPDCKGFFVEGPKNLKGVLAEAMNHRGPALVNVPPYSEKQYVTSVPYAAEPYI
jgi:hypothetical protein